MDVCQDIILGLSTPHTFLHIRYECLHHFTKSYEI